MEEECTREYVVNVVAHVNHGKTTLMDNVLEHMGVITKSMAGEVRLLDTRKDELKRGMTMKLSPVSLEYKGKKITFLDTPGHLEFNSITMSTFMITDVSIIVVDVMKGVTERLKGLVKKAEESKCAVIVFINKIDTLFKLSIPQDEIAYRTENIVQEINAVVESGVSWESGSVVIGSAKDNWAMSSNTDTVPIMRKQVERMTMKKAIGIAQKVYGISAEEAGVLANRMGMKKIVQLKANYSGKDILAHGFRCFTKFADMIINTKVNESLYHTRMKSVPDDVLGVVCMNNLLDGVVTAVVRMVHGRYIAEGDRIVVQEANGTGQSTVEQCVERIVSFEKTPGQSAGNENSGHRGLIGIQGIECKKRGVLVKRSTEESVAFMQTLPWAEFVPIFTDVITPEMEQYEEAVRRVSVLSRCEPGIYCTVTANGEIIVKSDGELQMDKIKTDLEGIQYETKEMSGEYMETVCRRSTGIVHTKEMDRCVRVTFDSTENVASVGETAVQLYNREVYMQYDESVPAEIKRVVASLLHTGPYIHAPCNRVVAEIETVAGVEMQETQTVQEIYCGGCPRILVNHTMVRVTIPSAYVKNATIAISKTSASIVSMEQHAESISFEIKIAVQEIRNITTMLRSLTKGECDVLPSNTVFYSIPGSREYEECLAAKIREEKGIHRKTKIEDE